MKFEGKNMPMAGDLLLYKSNGRSWLLSRLISKFSHAAGEDSKNGRYCHVSLVSLTGEDILEMTWPRARRTRLDLTKLAKHYDIELWRPKASYQTKMGALAWAQAHLGMQYDWSLIFFGLFDNKHKEVCSTFVRKAYLDASFDLYPNGGEEKIVSPSELVTSSLVERVW